jgi:peptide deformylase
MKASLVTADNPILRTPAQKVDAFDDELRSLVVQLWLTCEEQRGLGLAAPQVGVSARVAVVRALSGACITLINPAITRRAGVSVADERCLSLPGVVASVKRAASITVSHRDVRGKRVSTTAAGLVARAIQHEIDHLDGVLITERGVVRKAGDAA